MHLVLKRYQKLCIDKESKEYEAVSLSLNTPEHQNLRRKVKSTPKKKIGNSFPCWKRNIKGGKQHLWKISDEVDLIVINSSPVGVQYNMVNLYFLKCS